ncbi:MAG TPA: hypothetical protein VFT59_01285 [Candidatus Saccharimonadales bacterium]|nr:hypothetical protein [Candidatus Saccharimonadales bacterium]
MSEGASIESIAFFTDRLFETTRDEGVRIEAHRPGYFTGPAHTVRFAVHPVIDLNTLAQSTQGANNYYAQFRERIHGVTMDYLRIDFNPHFQPPTLTFSGRAAVQAIEDVRGELTGEEETPPRSKGMQLNYTIMNMLIPGMGHLAGKAGDHIAAHTTRPLKENVLETASVQHLIAIVQALIDPREE